MSRGGERGSAVVELAVLGPLVLGALVQVVVVFGQLQRAALATSTASREVGRVVVLADGPQDAAQRTDAVLAAAAEDHGLPSGSLHADVSGARIRGGTLRVRVTTAVPLLHLPLLGAAERVAVPVEATHVVRLDRYGSAP